MTDATKETKGLLLLVASFALVFIIAACTTEVIKEVPVEVIKTVEVVKEVVVEKVVEVEVIKEVAVETEVVKTVEIVKEVAVEVVVFATPVPAASLVAPSGQKYGGTIKIGVVDFGTMDPALMGLSEGSNLYSELTYDNAIVTDYDGELMPWALESWSANADASQYTLKVRQGITFHRGGEQNAKDIKFTFDRILDEATASPLQGVIDFITNIATPDDYTLVFDLEGPNAFLPGLLTDYHARILPDGVTSEEITTGEYGAGAFILGEHNPAERTVMHRNPNYWRIGYPFVDQVILFYMPEITTRVEAIKSGAIDVVFDPGFGALDTLEANPNVIINEVASAGVRVLDFHTNREPFNNKNLRKAFQYAVNRDFVREAVLFGHGANANDHPVGTGDEYYWDEQPIISQDIARAKEYLTLAGYPDGFDIVLHTTDMAEKLDMALAFKESVAPAGIRVEVSNNDPTTYWEEFWMNECCPFVASSWSGRPANQALDVQMRSGGVWNESYYSNPRLDELLDMANSQPDITLRKAYFQEIQEILIEDVPVLYLMHTPVIVTHRSRMMDVRAHPRVETFIENWWISD
ncbi:MAG: ABC transporter substrate-binding protein [SAR202 cluster bacterium]|nr:ABC transporter substrate-binding protein [SAR202 cluster bacterium]